MDIEPRKGRGNRFIVTLNTTNGEADDFALGINWFRRRVLLYGRETVSLTATTRSRTALDKIAHRLGELAEPPAHCSVAKASWQNRLAARGVEEARLPQLAAMASKITRAIAIMPSHEVDDRVDDEVEEPVVYGPPEPEILSEVVPE